MIIAQLGNTFSEQSYDYKHEHTLQVTGFIRRLHDMMDVSTNSNRCCSYILLNTPEWPRYELDGINVLIANDMGIGYRVLTIDSILLVIEFCKDWFWKIVLL